MRAILWADPGATTGLAAYFFNRGDGEFWCAQEQFRETGERVELLAREYGAELSLGYERFSITPGSGAGFIKHDGSALMVIGMLRWLALRHGTVMLPSQSPSDRRLGLAHLRDVGWYKSGKEHARDAAAHLLVNAMRDGWLPEELKVKLRGTRGN